MKLQNICPPPHVHNATLHILTLTIVTNLRSLLLYGHEDVDDSEDPHEDGQSEEVHGVSCGREVLCLPEVLENVH